MKSQNITAPVKATTQQFVEIEAVDEDVLLMSDKRCCCIIEATGVNFQLLSVEEQQSIIYSYSQLLNSLSFPIQIVVLSKKTDIATYLNYLSSLSPNLTNPKLILQLESYRDFIKTTIKQNTIIEKNFYVVIPFSPLEMGTAALKKTDSSYVFARAKASLYPKRDHIIKQLTKTGLGGVALREQEIVEVFYNLFNPSTIGRRMGPVKSYTNFLVTK